MELARKSRRGRRHLRKPQLELMEGRVLLATFTVTTTSDTPIPGELTLREALGNTSTNSVGDEILFNLSTSDPNFNSATGTWTIFLDASLVVNSGPGTPTPALNPVNINGLSQSPTGLPVIELRPSANFAGTSTAGLVLNTGGNTVQGFIINRFPGNGIQLNGGGNLIRANYIGTDVTGNLDRGNTGNGIEIAAASSGNTIGGDTAADRNVISGNDAQTSLQLGSGINIRGSSNRVENNYIGTNASGTARIGTDGLTASPNNNADGIETVPGADDNHIIGNVIAGNNSPNLGAGILIDSNSNVIQGNRIGVAANSLNPIPNTGRGVRILNGNSNTIGGTDAGNIIAFNASGDPSNASGIAIDAGTQNSILSNSIFANGDLGIDLGFDGPTPNDPGDTDTGANNFQNFPVLESATTTGGTTTFTGTLNSTANTTFILQFFANATANSEGEQFLGQAAVTTNSAGNASFSVPLATPSLVGRFFTATATDPNGNTSEFSEVGVPDVFLIKSTNGSDEDSAPGVIVRAGSTVTFTYEVINFGDVPLTNIVVRDDNGTPTNPADDFSPTLVSGDDNGNGLLDTDEVWTYTATRIATPGQHSNLATVTSTDRFGNPVSDDDPDNHFAVDFVVRNTNDSGPGSLREAIDFANQLLGHDTITFAIPGPGPHTIALASALPEITDPVTIDGYSQPGARANSLPTGNNANLLIELSGTSIVASPGTTADGLVLLTNDSVVRGLVINRFLGNGIVVHGSDNLIEGNFIGTDPTGITRVANGGNGILVQPDFSFELLGRQNTIGGTTPAARNLISGNVGDGIEIGSDGNLVQGNYIGTNAAGVAMLENSGNGILVHGSNNTIGGGTDGAQRLLSGNLISGNWLAGIQIEPRVNDGVTVGAAVFNQVLGNYIGTTASGNAALGNAGGGVVIRNASNNVVGLPGSGNVISGNPGLGGVTILSRGVPVSPGEGQPPMSSLAWDNFVLSNLIGTNAAGTASVPNIRGVTLDGATVNFIGGETANTRNVISGNGLGFGELDDDAVRNLGHGVGIYLTNGAAQNRILSNHVGTNLAGDAPLGNAYAGILAIDASSNTIGGGGIDTANVISGNLSSGIEIRGQTSWDNIIQANLIGLDRSGSFGVGNGNSGVFLADAMATALVFNTISGNENSNVQILGSMATGNLVVQNKIGTDVTGSRAILRASGGGRTQAGIFLNGQPAAGGQPGGPLTNNQILDNQISGNQTGIVLFEDTSAIRIQGNRIGTDSTGLLALPNENGIIVYDPTEGPDDASSASTPNVITDNQISGNLTSGVRLIGPGATGNVVDNNRIGTTDDGNAALPGRPAGADGVVIQAPRNTISNNVISGNGSVGVYLLDTLTTGNLIISNQIGTNQDGTAPVGNGRVGIFINNAPGNQITDNVISANGSSGVQVFGTSADGNVLSANRIGTNDQGEVVAGLGNQFGVFLNQGTGTIIEPSNIIRGNTILDVYQAPLPIGPQDAAVVTPQPTPQPSPIQQARGARRVVTPAQRRVVTPAQRRVVAPPPRRAAAAVQRRVATPAQRRIPESKPLSALPRGPQALMVQARLLAARSARAL